jgi:hypothetical protein
MTRDETLELFNKCNAACAETMATGASVDKAHEAAKAVWNAWAASQLAARRKIEVDGKWELLERRLETRRQWFQRHNQAMQAWLVDARADFAGCKIVLGEQTRERSPTLFVSGPWIDFRKFIFPGEADFTEAELAGLTFFDEANFEGPAWFRGLESNDVDFNWAIFAQQVSFLQATFSGAGHFYHAHFMKSADFRAIRSRGIFDLEGAKFTRLPNFTQAHFEEAPDMQDVHVPIPHFFGIGRREEVSAYRALRRIALQGHDYENEAMAFKGEIRAKRFTVHKPWHAAFWFGLLYDGFSDFGRSMIRPLCLWLLSVAALTTTYLASASKLLDSKETCADGAPHWLKALYLSVKSALPVVSTLRPDEVRSISACLYGLPPGNQEQVFPSVSAFIQLGQNLWSAVLIFLFLLAVRNQFKIK